MAENTALPRLVRIADLFKRCQVEYIVIGGTAAVLMGSPVPTFDVDVCYRRTDENLARLALALKEIHPTLRGAPKDLPFVLDARSLALGQNFTFDTDLGPLDLLSWLEPIGSYDDLKPNSQRMQIGNEYVDVIGLDDLIRIKKYLKRPKDRAALVQLEELRRLQRLDEA